jgi:hypothetical protein
MSKHITYRLQSYDETEKQWVTMGTYDTQVVEEEITDKGTWCTPERKETRYEPGLDVVLRLIEKIKHRTGHFRIRSYHCINEPKDETIYEAKITNTLL